MVSTLKSTSMARLLACVVAMSAAFTVVSSPVFAQDDAEVERAKTYYDKGVEAFFKQEYPRAITLFERANAIDPDPVILFNISLAQSKIGNARQARRGARRAQRMGGLPEDTALKNNTRIIGYNRVLTARRIAGVMGRSSSSSSPAPDKEGRPAGTDAIGTLGWTGVGVAGAGVAALIGAGVMNFVVSGKLDVYEDARTGSDVARARRLRADIDDRQSVGKVMLYSGIGLAAVGGALFAYDWFGSSESAADDDPFAWIGGSVNPAGAQVELGGTF